MHEPLHVGSLGRGGTLGHRPRGGRARSLGVLLQPAPTAAGRQEAGTLGSSPIAKPGETARDEQSAENRGRGRSPGQPPAHLETLDTTNLFPYEDTASPKRFHAQPASEATSHRWTEARPTGQLGPGTRGPQSPKSRPLPAPAHKTRPRGRAETQPGHSELSPSPAAFPCTAFSQGDSPHWACSSYGQEGGPSKEGRKDVVGLSVSLTLQKGPSDSGRHSCSSPQPADLRDLPGEGTPGLPSLWTTCSSRSSIESNSSPCSRGRAPWRDAGRNRSGFLSLSRTHTLWAPGVPDVGTGLCTPAGTPCRGRWIPTSSAGFRVGGAALREHPCHRPGLAGPS